jgi:hypothetical protein
MAYAQIEDLSAQLILISTFISDRVKYSGCKLSASFCDFKASIDYLTSLDYSQLQLRGSEYLRTVKVDEIKNRRFEYTLKEGQETNSNASSFDMFGGSFISSNIGKPCDYISARETSRSQLSVR